MKNRYDIKRGISDIYALLRVLSDELSYEEAREREFTKAAEQAHEKYKTSPRIYQIEAFMPSCYKKPSTLSDAKIKRTAMTVREIARRMYD